MGLRFIGKDDQSGADNCPAVFVEEKTGDLLFQGQAITEAAMLAEVDGHSRIASGESVVRLPSRMRAIIMEALSGDGSAVQ